MGSMVSCGTSPQLTSASDESLKKPNVKTPRFKVGMRNYEVSRAGGSPYMNPYPVKYCNGISTINADTTAYQIENYQFIYCWESGETNGTISQILDKADIERQIAQEKQKKLDENNKVLGTTGVGFKLENTYYLINDRKISVSGLVRNNTTKSIKDIKISCKYFANSGTELSNLFVKNSERIYERWNPNEMRVVSFGIDAIQQAQNIKCTVTDYSN
jgi:hypothetical protein